MREPVFCIAGLKSYIITANSETGRPVTHIITGGIFDRQSVERYLKRHIKVIPDTPYEISLKKATLAHIHLMNPSGLFKIPFE
jgi:hypothetical protein